MPFDVASAARGDGLTTYDSLRSASAAALLSEQPLWAVPSAAVAPLLPAACIDGESKPELGDVNVPSATLDRSLRMLRSVGETTASGGVEVRDWWCELAGVAWFEWAASATDSATARVSSSA